jgi:cobalt-zinc-cadmium resistance protein CzcA
VGINLLEGLLFVCLVLYLFLRNKYATLLVGMVVPLSLFFSFGMMILSGTSANLISLGAIDFGIIVDGGVIIVEYVLRRQHEKGGDLSSLDKTIAEVVRPVFFSMGMIILAYLPIFTLQRVEGKMFSPLAWTISFALLGALLLSLTVVPALLPAMLAKDSRHEEPGWLIRIRDRYLRSLNQCLNRPSRVATWSAVLLLLGAICFRFSGSEFLPELDEGALWIRASFPHSTSIEEGVKLAHSIRAEIKGMDEVRTVVSQLGGPEDGTDPNLMDNCEFFVDLKPKEQWKRFHHEREELKHFVRNLLAKFPGIDFNVSQPIADNVEEALAGVKGKNAAKIYGPDVKVLNQIASDLITMIRGVRGTAYVSQVASIPYVPHLTIRLDRSKVAQAGLALSDLNDLVEIAVGGKASTFVYDGETKIAVVVRAPETYRKTMEDIGSLPVALQNGAKTELGRLAKIEMVDAPQAIYREKGYRRIGVKFDVEGRDLGSVMSEILANVKKVNIPSGYFVEWDGDYQNQKRAMTRLLIVIPVTLLLVAVVLFILFEDLGTVGAVLATLFLSCVGSVFFLFVRGIPFSVSAAVGLLALFGVVALNGITLASTYKRIIEETPGEDPGEQIKKASAESFRSLVMTLTLAALGLVPAAFSHGIGSETQKPLATAVIGGMCTALLAVLFFLPTALATLERKRRSKNT